MTVRLASLNVVLLLFCLLMLAGCGYGVRYFASNMLYVDGEELDVDPKEQGLEYVVVDFENSDGDDLHGWMVPGEEDYPLIVYFHGNAANVTHGVDKIRFLHEAGFSVLSFEYRGYGKSEGIAIYEDDFYRDAQAALYWARRNGWDSPQMIYYGHSMGCSVALQLAIDHPPLGVILESAFTSFAGMFKTKMPVIYMFGGWRVREFDNLAKVPKLKSPLLIFHGAEDEVVPAWMARKLYAEAPEPKKIILVPDANHINTTIVGREEVQRALMDFSPTASKVSFH